MSIEFSPDEGHRNPVQDAELSQHLSPQLYQQLEAYQRQHQHSSLTVALNALLTEYFERPNSASAQDRDLTQQVASMDNRIYTLTRELVSLRQLVPNECDRLREQLAAVRLSHSGLLHNLRQRLETLEQTMGREDPTVLGLRVDPQE